MNATTTTPRPTPTQERAAGMLEAIRASHTCGEACTAQVTLGDGTTRTLRCPYTVLDLNSEADRRTIQTLYVEKSRKARQALGILGEGSL